MVVKRLAKLASYSAALRDASIQKEAFVGAAVGGAAKTGFKLVNWASKNPGKALAVGAGTVGGIGLYRQNKAGFEAASLQPETPKAL